MRKGKKRYARFWYDLRIPAYLFFDVLDNQNVRLLIKEEYDNRSVFPPKEKELQKAWSKLYDDFFAEMNDPKHKLILDVRKRIILYHRKIEMAQLVLFSVASKPMSKEQRDKLLTALSAIDVHINVENDHLQEIERALKVSIGSMKNMRALELENLKNLTKGAKSSFEDDCMLIEEHGYRPDERMSMKMYIAYRKRIKSKPKNNVGRQANRINK